MAKNILKFKKFKLKVNRKIDSFRKRKNELEKARRVKIV